MQIIKKLLVLLAGFPLLLFAYATPTRETELTVQSSNPKVVKMFNWAKARALQHVQEAGSSGPLNIDERNPSGTGQALYAPTYWAGYSNRSGYYSRDFAHQLVGAHLLGLELENKTMMRSFAASATPEHKFYPVWAINFDARTYLSIDYVSPDYFVREVPAVFELVEKAEAAYLWTGDEDYIRDPVFWAFYENALGNFVKLHSDADPERDVRIAQGTGRNIFLGTASYNEAGDEAILEAGDGVAAQYQGYRALASLAEAKGDKTLATRSRKQAKALKRYFNETWSVLPGSDEMVIAYGLSGEPITGWGKEISFFMPLKGIIEAGGRNEKYLSFIDAMSEDPATRAPNIESLTYLPDTFFRHYQNDTAWTWMQHIYDRRDEPHVAAHEGKNGDYPEVSFTLVSQTVAGLLGISPDAPNHALSTLSHLPQDIGWLEADAIPLGDSRLLLRHDGKARSSLTNTSGASSLSWEAQFSGRFETLSVDGELYDAQTKQVEGETVSYVQVEVASGSSVTVSVP